MAGRETFNMTIKPENNQMASASTQQHSPWHSPVPYLFGGLAAMLGLIAFALLILACSYWRLSGYLDNNNAGDQNGGERDLEAGEGKADRDAKKMKSQVMQEKFLVIMAGNVKPTYLATPASTGNGSSSSASTSRSSSFMETNKSCTCDDEEEEEKDEKTEEEEAGNGQARSRSTGRQDEPSLQGP